MKTILCILTALALTAPTLAPCAAHAADDSGNGGGDATRGGDGGAGGDGAVLSPPAISDEKLAAFERTLTPEQRSQLDEYERISAQLVWDKRADQIKKELAAAGHKIETLDEFVKLNRRQSLAWLAAMTPKQLQEFWKELPKGIKLARLQANPGYVDENERKAADALPAEARKEADDLLNLNVDVYLAARKKVLARGESCIPLISDKLNTLKEDDTRRIRLTSVLTELREDAGGSKDKLIRAAEAALRRVDELNAARPADSKSRYAMLVSRRLTGGRQAIPAYDRACYYSFPKASNGYDGAVSLEFDNSPEPDGLNVLMYGGQQNRIADLGAIELAGAGAASNAKAPAWSKQYKPGVAGHVYLEHCLEPRDGINRTFVFKIVELVSGEYIVIEWQEAPQAK